jgi:hypothetical protein
MLVVFSSVATTAALTFGLQGDLRAIGFAMVAATVWVITLVSWRDDKKLDKWLKERTKRKEDHSND